MSPYLQSLRLRTLPLSVSGIILGSGLALGTLPEIGLREVGVFVLALCTTLSLQILSNLSNELGDAEKGTDSNQHERAAYGLQSGTLTPRDIKRMIGLFIGLSVLFGTALVYAAFGSLLCTQGISFIGLGALAIIGAMTYTLGKHSYGYKGLGDLGVLLFFGLVSTVGSYYLLSQQLSGEAFACGFAIGLPCVGVLNLNNIRDMHNDILHGKKTVAGLLGQTGGRVYHSLLLMVCLVLFGVYGHYWTLCILPVWAWHLWYVWTHTERLDRQMPVLMFSTLAVSFLALIA